MGIWKSRAEVSRWEQPSSLTLPGVRMSGGGEGVRLTAAQLRALMWLPADGAWRTKPGKLALALSSLRIYHPEMAEAAWGDFGPRGGWAIRWRLTEAGIAERTRRDWTAA